MTALISENLTDSDLESSQFKKNVYSTFTVQKSILYAKEIEFT